MPVTWPTYEPISLEQWKAANPELWTDEECSECCGDGKVESGCACEECGHEHVAEFDCEACDATGVEGGGGVFEYGQQVAADRERWARYCLDSFGPEEIFVFGSNRQGRHGAGAAKRAVQAWGAKPGQAKGRQGMAYAIVTKELRAEEPPVTLLEIAEQVSAFLKYAADRRHERFLLTRIGGGLAGFDWPTQIRPMFDGRPENVVLLEERQA